MTRTKNLGTWSYRGKSEKQYVAPYGDSGRFGVTEWTGFIFCVEIDTRVSNFLSHRIVASLKFMIFDILGKSLHHQMILGPPDGSLDFFLNTRGF